MHANDKPKAIRRQLAAAAISLLGSSFAYPGTGQQDGDAATDKLLVDPSLLGTSQADSSIQASAPKSTANTEPPPMPSAAPADVPALAPDKPRQIGASLVGYKENDARVQVTEAIVSLKGRSSDESSTTVQFTYDALTGGSPNGALPSRSPQTFATPSGTSLKPAAGGASVQTESSASGGLGGLGACESHQSSLYSVAPGQLPIDKSFCDQRVALSVSGELPLDSANRISINGSASHELDFASLSLSTQLAHDLNGRNTTLIAGYNLETDAIRPIGGAPLPLSVYDQFQKQGNQSKHVGDLLFGVTQVMTRRWLTQLNFSLDRSTGYQNDPYKIISVLNADGSNANNAATNYFLYLYENRPQLRTRKSVYWENKFAFDRGDVVQLSYRRMSDDWGISSQTVDLRYRWAFGAGAYLEPHGRWYRQTAADFFRFYLQDTANVVYASADPRLAKFGADTVGLKLGLPMGDGNEFSIRAERYVQKGEGPATVLPQLQGLNLYPGLKAWLVQASLFYQF